MDGLASALFCYLGNSFSMLNSLHAKDLERFLFSWQDTLLKQGADEACYINWPDG